jgi:SAM-dependent methyltransferase
MTTTDRVPSPQEVFLRAYHGAHPALTSRTPGRGRAPHGRSGHALLRDAAAGHHRVLDLGCGDGLLLELLAGIPGRRLAGVDLSPDDLALARRRRLPSGTVPAQARAQELPFAAGAFDACVSHMALMLMDDVEQVARELARVLRNGGLLAVVLGGGAAGGEAYDLFRRLLRAHSDAAPAAARIPPLGDRRVRSRAGLDEVLAPAGFTPVTWETVHVDLTGTLEEAWATVSGLYDVDPLPPEAKAALRAEFTEEAAASARPDGTVPCAMRMHLATARSAVTRSRAPGAA